MVTPQREPLGVMNAWTWAREFKTGDAPRGDVLEVTCSLRRKSTPQQAPSRWFGAC
jgi:hypothetical protein